MTTYCLRVYVWLAPTKFNGIPQATHTQLGIRCIMCLQRPKKRWRFRTNKVIFSWTHQSEYTFLACIHFVLVWLILKHICPTSHIPSCSYPSPPRRCTGILFRSFPFSSRLSSWDQTLFRMMPGSRSEGEWGTSLTHSTPAEISITFRVFRLFSKILGCIASITPAAVLQKKKNYKKKKGKHIGDRRIVHGASDALGVIHL